MDPTPFFDYARERQLILLRRRNGQAKPWTTDARLRSYRFCNVFREDDVTTIWLRENVREAYAGRPELLLATVLFRWFNRISTGRALFDHHALDAFHKMSAFNWFLVQIKDGTSTQEAIDDLRESIKIVCGHKGPYVTGAYCIIGSGGMPKLDGVLDVFRMFCKEKRPFKCEADEFPAMGWRDVAMFMLDYPGQVSLESVWDWFRRYSRSGDFMAYEVVTDLAHSPGFLDRAPDRMTWANAGPGAVRGLNRLHGRPLEKQSSKENTCGQMQELLEFSQNPKFWPQQDSRPGSWPSWDMRTVEHTLCEFDKYQRIAEGGKVKQVYRG